MNRAQLETKVLQCVDLIRRGIKVEENLIEVKGEWPSPSKFARQLAGLCNAARGQPALAIFGIDEETGLLRAIKDEASTWYDKLCARFEGLAPRQVDHITVPVDKHLLHVFLFETNRAPYVIHVLDRADQPTGQFEVPFRTATQTRSARREDLLRILAPAVHVPQIDILGGHLHARFEGSDAQYVAQLELYCTTEPSRAAAFAAHRMHITLSVGSAAFSPPEPFFALEGPTASRTKQELVVSIANRFSVNVTFAAQGISLDVAKPVLLSLRCYPAGSDSPAIAEVWFQPKGFQMWIADPVLGPWIERL